MNILRRWYRRLRNLDRVEATEMQLAACRALLAVTMRDRDHALAAFDQACSETVQLRLRYRRQQKALRIWMTHGAKPNISLN